MSHHSNSSGSREGGLGAWLSSNTSKYYDKGKQEFLKKAVKTRLSFEHSLGLGDKPNVIPDGEASIAEDLRTVEIGWHPVPGGNWLAKKTFLGKAITHKIGKYPDPTQHWAVIVGDYVHQLWMDEQLDIIYLNEHCDREEWTVYEVGKTRFNDQALYKAAKMTIHHMRDQRPAYNLISNNCQNFAANLLDNIQIGAHKEFATAFAVYSAATGEGAIKDLFVDKHPEEAQGPGEAAAGGQVDDEKKDKLKTDEDHIQKLQRQSTVNFAQQVMNENTTQIDNHLREE